MESKDEVIITKNDVMGIMDVFTRVPPLILKMVVKGNKNVVKSFETQIKEYQKQLDSSDMVKIEKVLEMDVPDLQEILKKAYLETGQKQLKILADPHAEEFISGNLRELKKILFPSRFI
jgi:hypothetical protein